MKKVLIYTISGLLVASAPLFAQTSGGWHGRNHGRQWNDEWQRQHE